MRRTRRLTLARVLAAVAIAIATGAAAGCGSSSSDGSKAKSKTVTVWHQYVLDSQFALLKKQAALFEAKHPGAKVRYVYVPAKQYIQKLIAAAPTRTGPDVILREGSTAQQLKDANAIADITECVASWPTSSDIAPFAPVKLGDATYGVLPYGNLVALWYNKTLLDEHGLKPPKTIGELEDAMAKVTTAGKTGMTISANPTFEGAWSAFPFFTSEGVTFPDVDKPATQKVFERLAAWSDKGWVPRSASTLDQVTAMQKFLTGNVAFTVNGNWESDHAKKAAKFDYGVTLMPRGTEPARVYISGESAMIGNFAKNPDLACDYLGDSWFSEAGQTASVDLNKSIPTLKSLSSSHPALAKDPVLSVFAKQAATADGVPGGQTAVANTTVWGPAVSAAFAGNKKPAEIAATAISGTQKIVKESAK